MNSTIRNVLAAVAGLAIGSIVNMSLINLSSTLIPPPEGVVITTMEGLLEAIPLFKPKHFIMPFLAHALGTLAGAIIASLIATGHRLKFALGVGGFFLLGGITNAFLLPSPSWFIAVDIILAYLPMGWLGWKLSDAFILKGR